MFFAEESQSTKQERELQEKILREAQDLGLLDEHGKEILVEARRASYKTEVKKVKVTRDQKIARLIQRTSIMLGKEKDDPDYKAWRKHRDLAEKYRRKLERKFHSKAAVQAKKVVSGATSGPSSEKGSSKSSTDLPSGAGSRNT
jgi:hypothetical protein